MGEKSIGETLILTQEDVRSLLGMGEVVQVVEKAFLAYAKGDVEMPPKAYLKADGGDFRAMPARMGGSAGVKWVNAHPGNPNQGLPSVMAVFIFNDASTGCPLAVMDATEITAYRTGATAAIASKHLARRRARTLGLVGAGRQARSQLAAHMEVFDLESVRVYDTCPEAVRRFVESYPDVHVQACSVEETVSSDIVCTLTPARSPVVRREWVRHGTHINAVGADAAGKQELDPAILKDALVVVDELRQASAGGEINMPLTAGEFRLEQVYGTLAEVVAGIKPGREHDDRITVFDSTGVAIEDLATAELVYERAREQGKGVGLRLVAQ